MLEAATLDKGRGLPWIPTVVGMSGDGPAYARSARCALTGGHEHSSRLASLDLVPRTKSRLRRRSSPTPARGTRTKRSVSRTMIAKSTVSCSALCRASRFLVARECGVVPCVEATRIPGMRALRLPENGGWGCRGSCVMSFGVGSGSSSGSSMCKSRVGRLRMARHAKARLDTSQTNARSMASSKGWRLDGVTTPYARVCVRVMGAIMQPPGARPICVVPIRRNFRLSP
jgi:hypothetical protein